MVALVYPSFFFVTVRHVKVCSQINLISFFFLLHGCVGFAFAFIWIVFCPLSLFIVVMGAPEACFLTHNPSRMFFDLLLIPYRLLLHPFSVFVVTFLLILVLFIGFGLVFIHLFELFVKMSNFSIKCHDFFLFSQ